MIRPTGKHKTKQNGRYMKRNKRAYLWSDEFFRDHLLFALNTAFASIWPKWLGDSSGEVI